MEKKLGKKLVDRAKKMSKRNYRCKKYISEEGIDAAIAWLKEEIGTKQLALALFGENKRSSGGNVLYFIATVLRYGYETGIIDIIKKNNFKNNGNCKK